MSFSKTHTQKLPVRKESLILHTCMSCNLQFRTMSVDTKRKSHLCEVQFLVKVVDWQTDGLGFYKRLADEFVFRVQGWCL